MLSCSPLQALQQLRSERWSLDKTRVKRKTAHLADEGLRGRIRADISGFSVSDYPQLWTRSASSVWDTSRGFHTRQQNLTARTGDAHCVLEVCHSVRLHGGELRGVCFTTIVKAGRWDLWFVTAAADVVRNENVVRSDQQRHVIPPRCEGNARFGCFVLHEAAAVFWRFHHVTGILLKAVKEMLALNAGGFMFYKIKWPKIKSDAESGHLHCPWLCSFCSSWWRGRYLRHTWWGFCPQSPKIRDWLHSI